MARRGHNEGSIYRRTDGYWVGCLQLGYDAGSGKRQRKYFYGVTRREVQERLTKALADHRNGLLQPDDRLTVEQYLTTIWLPSFAASVETQSHALWLLFATTGLRLGEATGLRWRDVDLERGTARIQRALQRQHGVGLVFVEPKTELSRRTVYLPAITIGALSVHRPPPAQDGARRAGDLLFPPP